MGPIVLLLASSASAWPGGAEWLPLTRAGAPPVDPFDPALPVDLDLVGDALTPLARWWADGDALWLGLSLAAPSLGPGARGLLIESTGDGAADLLLLVEGDALFARRNLDGIGGTDVSFVTWGPAVALGDEASGAVRIDGGYLDLRVTRVDLAALGVFDDTPLRIVPVAGESFYLPWSDVGVCAGPAPLCPALADVLADPVWIDRDEDGRTDAFELRTGTSPTDADTDDDGLLDGEEPFGDPDGDGFENARDCDSDNDGVRDGVEAGITAAMAHPHTDQSSPCFRSDADPLAPPTDPYAPDTDGGGLSDGREDWNRNGRVDAWETDPNDPSDDIDTDGDGIADALELLGADGEIDDEDSDGDGIPDAIELLHDPDGDGIPAFLDLDSDGDGIPDAVEGSGDGDGDGIRDFLDLDSDGDGIPDAVEGSGDTDGDGIPDYLDLDSDGDGLTDAYEGAGDCDGDGVPNHLDLDSDSDGLPDSLEGAFDTDNDGIRNACDVDSDNDGIPDGVEGATDVDADGLPNHRDLNSDGTFPNDAVEGTGDIDCDGIPNFLDADDEDGFCDPPQSTPAIAPPPVIPDPPVPPAGGCATVPGVGAWALLGLLALRRRRSSR